MQGEGNLACTNGVINILPNYWYSHTLKKKIFKDKTNVNKVAVPN